MKHVWVGSLESKRYSFESCDMWVIFMQNLTCVLSGVACSRSGFFKKQFMRCNVLCETTKALPTWMMLWLKGPVTNDKTTQNKHAIYSHWQVCKTFFLRSPALIIHWEVMCTMWFAKLTENWQIHMEIFAFTYTYWKLSREKTFTNFTQLTHPPTHPLTHSYLACSCSLSLSHWCSLALSSPAAVRSCVFSSWS